MKRLPILLGILIVSACSGENDDLIDPPAGNSWEVIGDSLPKTVTCLYASDSTLLVSTSDWDEELETTRIWSWEDCLWVQMTTPLYGRLKSMKWFNGALVVAGLFELFDDPAIRSLAQWNGDSWEPVGQPLQGAGLNLYPGVRDITLWNDLLVIGGYFTVDGCGTVATWDGQSLTCLTTNLNIATLSVWRDSLIVGGADGGDVMCQPGPRLLKWSRGRFVDFAGGARLLQSSDCPPIHHVSKLLPTDVGIVVAGNIPRVGDHAIQNIARWDGLQWLPMGEGFTPNDLVEIGGSVYSAGDPYFEPFNVLRWNGSEWSPVGESFDGPVSGLEIFDGHLIAAGSFSGGVARIALRETLP